MLRKSGEDLRDLDAWYRLAGPKSPVHWKDERSAKESARYWLEAAPDFPGEIGGLVSAHPDFGELLEWEAEPEAPVRFDQARGEPSNLDVLVRARDASGRLVIAVEAKADESFGGTLEDTMRQAKSRLETNPRSQGVRRIIALLASILGRDRLDDDVTPLRYQLFTATAAAAAEAVRLEAERAVVLVHEFVSEATSDERHDANASDLDRFIAAVTGTATTMPVGRLIGPYALPGAPLFESCPRLYFGKVRTDLRARDV